jgi:transcriptional regulator
MAFLLRYFCALKIGPAKQSHLSIASFGRLFCKMPKHQNDRLQGTLDLVILKILARSDALHGYAIAQRIHELTDRRLRIEEGSMYPALHRMANEKWLRAEWGVTETNRKARFYKITSLGLRQLREEEKRWFEISGAVAQILKFA